MDPNSEPPLSAAPSDVKTASRISQKVVRSMKTDVCGGVASGEGVAAESR